mmetsp:Transcript_11616/g.17337  ORF Transcript_11616/g.17337 Transcript_11616/m.17337 type:complete len:315 (-) Transcript_11616:221-1165(-)
MAGLVCPKYKDADVKEFLGDETKAEEVGYNMVKVRGVPQNPLFDAEKFETMISNFESRESDVFICTYVKAGTTWTQQIVTLLLNNGVADAKSYGEQVPWLEALCAVEILPEREAPGWTPDKVKTNQERRFFKSHAMVSDLPGGSEKPKIIAVARNPKDTVVSLYHHAKSKPEFGYKGDFDTFIRVFLSGNAENGSWFKHVREWYAFSKAYPHKCLWLTYEQMINDHRAAVIAIAHFLEISYTDELIDKVVQNSTIKSMQNNKKANIGINHLRQGGIGNWRNTFTVSQSNLFDTVYKANMAGSGLHFDFGEGLYM